LSPFEHFDYLKHLDRSIACTSSPLRAGVTGGRAVRARREGVPGGGGGGACSARRTSEVVLDKKERQAQRPSLVRKAQHDSAKFGTMILEMARDLRSLGAATRERFSLSEPWPA